MLNYFAKTTLGEQFWTVLETAEDSHSLKALGAWIVDTHFADDDAEEQRAIPVRDFEGLSGGHLADELDLIALEHDRLPAASGHIDEEADGRALLAADAAEPELPSCA